MGPPHEMSNIRFGLLTFGLLLIWLIVISNGVSAETATIVPSAQQTNAAYPAASELKNTKNCKALCEHCDCQGFYCGEECLCECNKKNDETSDNECIATMQNNARKLNIPFELLIQGPDSNRFVHNALQFANPANEMFPSPLNIGNRNKRSTVVIYKPSSPNAISDGQCERKDARRQQAKALVARHKRSAPQLDWFSDLANTLVRPAPLRLRQAEAAARNAEAAAAPLQKKRSSTDVLDHSWFTDNTHSLLQPAPLFKRRLSSNNDDQSDESSFESPLAAVEKFPDLLKDTIRKMQQSAIKEEDLNEVFRMKPHSSDLFENQMQGQKDIYPKNGFESFAETFANMRPAAVRNEVAEVPTIKPNTAAPPQEFKFINPWLRPVRFLQRVQQAIN